MASMSMLNNQRVNQQVTIEIVDFPIKNSDFPIKTGDFPLKIVMFPLKLVISN